ncbi:lysophospholipid acyltransferase family protein [Roseomonas xinghualingensis]|uniref:lysophospholipid acyltransferase family protein n=1 Tax=Roseomonas xinghualingensis TaxID=2986475 RepID=UPI0021F1EA1D|nr:lysophospholipid acyltransferase family protein [Roseomonas sp. SXEYE001]MCV4207387.1 lysophospholipid acyltransferase family protein [Roseomonas sp. SXEYE001]
MGKRRKGPISRWLKSLGKSPALWGMVGWYLDLCSRTARVEIHAEEPLVELAKRPEGFVLAFWHECLPLMPTGWVQFWKRLGPSVPRKPGLVLVSRSRDGTMISSTLDRFGLTAVSGSSSRGGREAGLNLLRGVRSGAVAVMVPDGPRGPRREISEGPVRLAAMAGVPVVPCGAFAVPSRRLGSWDRMILPMPFARFVAVVGEPILPEKREAGELAALLAKRLNGCVEQAEALCGVVEARKA